MTDLTRRRPATLKHVAMGLALAMTVQILSACVPVLVGTATVTGIELYLDRRSVVTLMLAAGISPLVASLDLTLAVM